MFVKFDKSNTFQTAESKAAEQGGAKDEADKADFQRMMAEKKKKALEKYTGKDTASSLSVGEEGGKNDRAASVSLNEPARKKECPASAKTNSEPKSPAAPSEGKKSSGSDMPAPFTSKMLGEEGGVPGATDGNEAAFTTKTFGEEGGKEHTFTTAALGEEGGYGVDPASDANDANDAIIITAALGEQGGGLSDLIPPKSIIEDDEDEEEDADEDNFIKVPSPTLTTQMLAEEGGNSNRRT